MNYTFMINNKFFPLMLVGYSTDLDSCAISYDEISELIWNYNYYYFEI